MPPSIIIKIDPRGQSVQWSTHLPPETVILAWIVLSSTLHFKLVFYRKNEAWDVNNFYFDTFVSDHESLDSRLFYSVITDY